MAMDEKRKREGGGRPVIAPGIDRFRPSDVLSGIEAAFAGSPDLLQGRSIIDADAGDVRVDDSGEDRSDTRHPERPAYMVVSIPSSGTGYTGPNPDAWQFG